MDHRNRFASLLKRYHEEAVKNCTAVQVVSLANEMGIEVYQKPMSSGLAGEIVKKDDGAYVIYVNEEHNAEKKRHTIAFQLARFVLHKNSVDNPPAEISYRETMEANDYASEILMPEELIKELERSTFDDIIEMSDILKVDGRYLASRQSTLKIRNIADIVARQVEKRYSTVE
jgi:Zn-dependent peptidase ImmA (M78 family)